MVPGDLAGGCWFAHIGVAATAGELPYDQFNQKLDNGQIYEDDRHPLDLMIEEGSSVQTLAGFYSDLLPAKDHLDQLHAFCTTISLDHDRDIREHLKSKGLTPNMIHDKSNPVAVALINFLPPLAFLLIVFAPAVGFGVALWTLVRWVATRRYPGPIERP